MNDRGPALTLRVLVFALLIVGMLGVGTELLLLEHWEDPWQQAPLVVLAVGVCSVTWEAVMGTRASSLCLQIAMTLFVIVGCVGLWLHFKGNIEFEREMYPTLKGLPLVWQALKGATPAVAPGMLAFIGLLGLAYTLFPPSSDS